MRILSSKGESILIGGEAKARIIEGKGEIFGYIYEKGQEITVEEDKSIPLTPVSESLEIEVEFGEGGYLSFIRGDLIPESWRKLGEEICGKEGKMKVMVLGGVDSGKTGLVTFLANFLLQCNKKVAVIDADTGQSSIGPPTLISLGFVNEPITQLSQVELFDAFFVGSTSPSGVFERSIVGVLNLLSKAFSMEADAVIIDTTGWVTDRGRELKLVKILAVKPDYLVLVEKEFGELIHMAKPFLFTDGIHVKNIDSPPMLRARSRETRRDIRKRFFAKYLEKGELVEVPINTVNIRYSYFGSGKPVPQSEITEMGLNPQNIYIEVGLDQLIIYSSDSIDPSILESLKEIYGAEPKVISKEEIENTLVCLKDKNEKFLGLGIIKDFKIENRSFLIYTRCKIDDIKSIEVGHIKVNEEGEEVGWVQPWHI